MEADELQLTFVMDFEDGMTSWKCGPHPITHKEGQGWTLWLPRPLGSKAGGEVVGRYPAYFPDKDALMDRLRRNANEPAAT